MRNLYSEWLGGTLTSQIISESESQVSVLLKKGVAVALPELTAILYQINNIELNNVTPHRRRGYVAQMLMMAHLIKIRAQIEGSLIDFHKTEFSDSQGSNSLVETLLEAHNSKNQGLFTSALNTYMNTKTFNEYVDWFEVKAGPGDLQDYAQQYGADQVYFTQYLSLLSTSCPESMAVEIYHNLFDETGHELSHGTKDLENFHPSIFRRFASKLGAECQERFGAMSEINWETQHCTNLFLLSIRMGYLEGGGALLYCETSIPYQLNKINIGATRLGLSPRERLFLDLHCGLDVQHGNNWWQYALKPSIRGREDIEALVTGVNLGISARNILWKGLDDRRNQNKISQTILSFIPKNNSNDDAESATRQNVKNMKAR